MRLSNKLGAIGWIGGIALLAGAANAGILTLSSFSSDETDAALLDATIEFDIVGTTVEVTVTNDTTAPNEYNINQVYFNGNDIFGLSLQPTSGWSLTAGLDADGFGVFDFALTNGSGINDPDVIGPGESRIFTLDIAGGAAVMNDFTSNFSTIPPGDMPMLGALKFVSGPGDDSAFGAVPAPGAAALFGLAGLATARRRRR